LDRGEARVTRSVWGHVGYRERPWFVELDGGGVRVGQRVAFPEKGGCFPPILMWNKILACIFSLSFQTLKDKNGRALLQYTLTKERGGCWTSQRDGLVGFQ
jgi:hypothetical protein